MIVPVTYKANGQPAAHCLFRSHINLLALRGSLIDGKPDAASKMFRDGVKIYPQRQVESPPKMHFTTASAQAINIVHVNNFEPHKEFEQAFQQNLSTSSSP